MKKRNLTLVAIGLSMVLTGCGASEAVSDISSNSTVIKEETSVKTDSVGTGETYNSEGDNEHAILVSGEEASYDNISVTKTGDGEGDEADFYGTNAAVYAENGATLTITNSKITTNGAHANAVFSYGDGTVVNISDSTIDTSQNNSGGIMVTGGGTLNASNLVVTTQAGSSAAIRSDRGGGVMNVDGGTYTSYGSGSPAIYSTADVTVKNATLYSDVSQAVVVEGKNSVTLENVDATGKNTNKNSDKSDQYQAVMIYQSMSGDADEGEGIFNMTGGSLTSLNGGMFFVTNTVAEVNLDNVELVYATEDLLRIEAAGWGNEGSNGGQVNFNACNQNLQGVINVDDNSKLNLYLKDGSYFEGSIAADGDVYVEIENGVVWKLTGDSNIKALTCSAGSIDLNGYTLTVDGTEYVDNSDSKGEAIEFTQTSSSKGAPDGNGNAPQGQPDGNAPQGAPDGNGNAPQGQPGGEGQGKPDGDAPQGQPGGDGQQGQGGPGNPPSGQGNN